VITIRFARAYLKAGISAEERVREDFERDRVEEYDKRVREDFEREQSQGSEQPRGE
jgi:hypothetical protein